MAEAAQILEAIMIISFGIFWPMNIIKSYRTKSTRGKSLLFLLFIDFGYVCGVVGKIVGDNITWVVRVLCAQPRNGELGPRAVFYQLHARKKAHRPRCGRRGECTGGRCGGGRGKHRRGGSRRCPRTVCRRVRVPTVKEKQPKKRRIPPIRAPKRRIRRRDRRVWRFFSFEGRRLRRRRGVLPPSFLRGRNVPIRLTYRAVYAKIEARRDRRRIRYFSIEY